MVGWFIFDEVRIVAPHEVDALLLLATIRKLFFSLKITVLDSDGNPYKDENGTHYLQDGHHRFAALHFLNVQQHVCEVFRKNENADEYNSFTVEKR